MTTEDRLRDALHAEADQIHPRDGWTAIEARMGKAAPRNRRLLYGLAAAATLVLVAAAAVALQDKDSAKPVLTNPGETTTTTLTAANDLPRPAPFVWPIDESVKYETPETMAAAFVHEFLGVADASVGTYRAGDTTSGEIDVKSSFGTVISTLLAQRDIDGSWRAVEAVNPHLVIDTPEPESEIRSPQTITGSSVAFEGTVHVTLYGYESWDRRQPCGACHPFLATTTFTGHGTEMGPYETSISWSRTTDKWGLLMLWTDSARDGSLAEATVRYVHLS
jgi:hypothetical protein